MQDDTLIFDAAFEALASLDAVDRSPLRRPLLATGTPTGAHDGLLGAAARFDGAAGLQVTLPEQGTTNPAFTIAAWIRIEGLPALGHLEILKFGGNDPGALVWRIDTDGILSITLDPHPDRIMASLPVGAWRHIAVVADETGVTGFVDGSRIGTTLAAQIDPRTSELTIGAPPESVTATGMIGSVAKLRVYAAARDAAQLTEQILRDRTPLGNFDNANPLNLRLLDSGDKPLIYIDDVTRGQPLTLEIQNVSTHNVRLPKGRSGAATLTLAFRPGTLHPDLYAKRTSPVGVRQHERWSADKPRKRPDGTVAINLKPKPGALPIELAPGQTELVTLTNVRADAGSGTRSSQVQFGYEGLVSDDPILTDASNLSGEREAAITVINHNGRPNAPLSVTLDGNGKLLPGSNGQSLTLRITNTAEDRPLELTPETIFKLHVAHGKSNRAALLQETRLAVADTRVGPSTWSISLDDSNAENPALRISPAQPMALGAHEAITITLSNLAISTLPGRAPLRVTHSHLPGFWYGSHDLSVEKTALSEDDTGQIGIGLEPEKPLHIKGRKSGPPHRTELVGFSDESGKRKWHLNYQDGLNWSESGVSDDRFFIGDGGRVGIGTGEPEADLHLVGKPLAAATMKITSPKDHFTALRLDATGYPVAEVSASKGTMSMINSGQDMYIGTSGTGSLYWRKDVLESDDIRLAWTEQGVTVKKTFLCENDAIFQGDVSFTGTISSRIKNFVIPHPDRPADVLVHSCLEGPEAGVCYRGEGVLSDGQAIIALPDYFEGLTRPEGRTVHLTAQGREPFLLSYEPVREGRFTVHGTKLDGAFSWEVRAVRADVDPVDPEPGRSTSR